MTDTNVDDDTSAPYFQIVAIAATTTAEAIEFYVVVICHLKY